MKINNFNKKIENYFIIIIMSTRMYSQTFFTFSNLPDDVSNENNNKKNQNSFCIFTI